MKGDEVLHPGHHSIRWKYHDYAEPDFYFCDDLRAQEAVHFRHQAWTLINECWNAIPEHFPQANLHAFVVMPNHVHGIIEIRRQAGAQHAAPLPDSSPNVALKRGSLGAIVRSCKAAVTKKAREELQLKGEIWQRNYFERVLRDAREIADAYRYIAENAMMWELDRENPERRC